MGLRLWAEATTVVQERPAWKEFVSDYHIPKWVDGDGVGGAHDLGSVMSCCVGKNPYFFPNDLLR